MEITKTKIADLLIIKPKIFEDKRGYFFESYNQMQFKSNNLNINFVQDNQSLSSYGTIRGLHYQLAPYAQTKLIRVLQGKIFDVAVDIREHSPTFGQWFGKELSAENNLQLLVPRGFAHGFSVISERATVLYKCDNLYNHESERGINFLDKKLNIDWKIVMSKALVSSKDNILPTLNDAEMNFKF
jgi:dTDP-4-dehydrorhamnose 3,5-epimerase